MAHLKHMHCVTLMSSDSNVLDSDRRICVAKTKDANNGAQGCDVLTLLDVCLVLDQALNAAL